MNQIIQGLWIGPELSTMEQLSIASFLRQGHDYHLYVYDNVLNVPQGTVLKDASEILPAARIFKYKEQQSYAGFANFFRYKLLFERGGWWADTDTVCLRRFDFSEPHVFATEICDGRELIASAIIKAPSGSEAMGYAWEMCQTKDPAELRWGETGPKLTQLAVERYLLQRYVKPALVFCPLGYLDWHKVLEAGPEEILSESSYAIHLWHEMWRGVGQDKNAAYADGCLYEQLKRRYLT